MGQVVSSSNARIAKNTAMLYLRMLLSIAVGLYTSRVVLQTLGVEDYGIYGVVGGIVSMFSFLNSAMSGATSRFLTYEMGRGNDNRLSDTFSSALIVHVGIALVVLLLSETIGIWFLCNKLVIPDGRMAAATVVFQCSVLSMCINVTQVPYNAAIIAHERMDIYAYIELLNVFLKLGIVYLLVIWNWDKLILYSVLVLMVQSSIAMLYRIYCINHYSESRFHFVWKKDILVTLTSFSGYNLLGNFGAVFNLQGINFIINIFFGVVLNAASSIASTVSGIINGFVSNIVVAFRPPITKAYAQNDIMKVENLLALSLKSVVIVHSLFVVPLFLEIDTVLEVWLGIVPDYASIFCRLILISIYFETIRYILVIGIHATGKVKRVSLATGICYILNPFAIYLCLQCGVGPEISYIGNIVVNLVLIGRIAHLLHLYIAELDILYLLKSIIPPFGIALVALLVLPFLTSAIEPGVIRVLITTLSSSLLIMVLGYVFCLSQAQRIWAIAKIKSILHCNG